jgi:NAD(P)-dependent dehydrogenase (short-subunit alcohol dehydrogenase family)
MLGRKNSSVYAAAKAGLVGFTKSWAIELAPSSITVNCVAPGPIETEMFNRNNPIGSPGRKSMLDAIPMSRLGDPREVASAVIYFLSKSASFTTGQTIFVCGGASITQQHF